MPRAHRPRGGRGQAVASRLRRRRPRTQPARYAEPRHTHTVIPAQAGIQTRRSSMEPYRQRFWIPACAGMTKKVRD
ncbi:hypothetical protein D9602_00305 [Sphingomonas sp. TX0522]|nr:hypothetical protein [Sphingomonas sp. TX0522]